MDNNKLVEVIIKEYYKAVADYFTDRKLGSSKDVEWVFKHLDKFVSVYNYFPNYLHSIWERFFNYSSASDEVKYPYIGAFIQYGLLDEMYDMAYAYRDNEVHNKKRYLLEHSELANVLAKENEFEWSVWFETCEIEFTKGDPKFGDNYANEKKKRELINYLYELVYEEAGDE
jgi:hypothetical protein